jgi:acyl carrier protein
MPAIAQQFTPPADFQAAVAGVWAEVLGVPHVAEDDDFFQLGGDSILIVVMLTRLEELYGVFFDIDTIFEHPVLRDFCARLSSVASNAA